MSPPSLLVRAALCVLPAVAALPASARVLTLSRQDDANAIVRDAASGDVTSGVLGVSSGRLLVPLGALAADDAHDLLYVALAADPAAGPPTTPLVAVAYGCSMHSWRIMTR